MDCHGFEDTWLGKITSTVNAHHRTNLLNNFKVVLKVAFAL